MGKRFRKRCRCPGKSRNTPPACRAETDERGEFTGRLAGRNSFGPSKIAYVKDFLATDTCRGLTAADVVFYSDSMVDMPLFNFVDAAGGTCVAVNASPELAAEADRRGWKKIATYTEEMLARAMIPAMGAQFYPEVFRHV